MHREMRDNSWTFLITALENLVIEVLFNAEFNGIIRIFRFHRAISIKIKI